MTEKMSTDGDMAFEEAMEKLEEISGKLAGDNVPLDEAIALYEQGVAYYDICKGKLNDAENRIRIIEESLDG